MGYKPVPMPPSPLKRKSRTGRTIKTPITWKDVVPSTTRGLPSQIADVFHVPSPSPRPDPPMAPEAQPAAAGSPVSPSQSSSTSDIVFQLPRDDFGTYREYTSLPARDPEAKLTEEDHCNRAFVPEARANPAEYHTVRWLTRSVAVNVPENLYAPFENQSRYQLSNWWYDNANTKSLQDLDRLAKVLTSEGFSVDDLKGFSARREMELLDRHQKRLWDILASGRMEGG